MHLIFRCLLNDALLYFYIVNTEIKKSFNGAHECKDENQRVLTGRKF